MAAEKENKKEIKRKRANQAQEILRILEEENAKEIERDEKLASVSDPIEKRRLEKILAAERAKAQQKIQMMMEYKIN